MNQNQAKLTPGAAVYGITYRSPVTHEENEALARRFAAGDDSARVEMIDANFRLVHHWARRYVDQGVTYEDLVQEGVFGLDRAVRKFDLAKGFKFSTYATWWIRQPIQRAIASQGRMSKIPDEVTRAELNAELDGNIIALVPRVIASLDAEILSSTDGVITFGDRLADVGPTVEDEIEKIVFRSELLEMIDRLPHIQAEIIRLRYGFYEGPALSLTAVAKKLRMSHRAVAGMERAARDQLKMRFRQEMVGVG